MDDPNRPRFTTQELKDILHERNELKARVSDLEDELETYRPKNKAETYVIIYEKVFLFWLYTLSICYSAQIPNTVKAQVKPDVICNVE